MFVLVEHAVCAEDEVVGQKAYRIVVQGVCRVEGFYADISVSHDFPFDVNVLEWSEDAEASCCPRIHLVHDALQVVLQKFNPRVVQVAVEGEDFWRKGNVSVDECLPQRTIVCHTVDVDGVVGLVPVSGCAQCSQPSIYEAEVLYA